YPLTEDRCMELIKEWAGEAGEDTPGPADPAPTDEEALLREARSVYATGLLSIAMTNEDYAGQASSSALVPQVAKYLRKTLLDSPPSAPHTAAAAPAPAAAPPAPAAPAPAAATAVAPAPAAPAPPRPPLCHPIAVLRRLRLQYCAALLGCVGEFVDALGPLLVERGAEALLELMRRYGSGAGGGGLLYGSGGGGGADGRMLYDALGACVALTAHRRFSEVFVEAGGVEVVLGLPRNPHTYSGLATLLYSLAAAPLAFERLLTPSPSTSTTTTTSAAVEGSSDPTATAGPTTTTTTTTTTAGGSGNGNAAAVVSAALSLLSCGQDGARRTAVSFLSAIMTVPATLREFQGQEGVRRMLNLLRALLTGVRGAAAAAPDLRTERQVGYYAALTLRMFIAAHLVLHVSHLRRSLTHPPSSSAPPPSASSPQDPTSPSATATAPTAPTTTTTTTAPAVLPYYRPVDTSREALDALTSSLECDRRLAEAFARCRWPALELLLDAGAPGVLLELVSELPHERWFHETMQAALEGLRMLTQAPLARKAVLGAVVTLGG
ncbi:hypothetical protein Agub_g3469, partial [Astrephomene gubernaculifera]